MSNVESFYKAIATDEALQTKLKNAYQAYNGSYEEVILPVAKEAGYDFSMSDVAAYEESLKSSAGKKSDELDNAGYATINGCGCVLYGQGTWLGEPSPATKVFPEGWGACAYTGSISCVKNGG